VRSPGLTLTELRALECRFGEPVQTWAETSRGGSTFGYKAEVENAEARRTPGGLSPMKVGPAPALPSPDVW